MVGTPDTFAARSTRPLGQNATMTGHLNFGRLGAIGRLFVATDHTFFNDAQFVRFEIHQDGTFVRAEQQHQSHTGRQCEAQAHCYAFVIAAEIDGTKSQPDNAGRIHGETDKFGFVEIFGQISRFHGIKCTRGDKEEIESVRSQKTECGSLAHQFDTHSHAVVVQSISLNLWVVKNTVVMDNSKPTTNAVMTNWAVVLMNLGFLVMMRFLLPDKIRAMRFVLVNKAP
uniref:Uncharacterized protein n=1 Tax=Romanomermis culicivorax TaxID=13658 RepID=A0A915JSZ1_ROMCU